MSSPDPSTRKENSKKSKKDKQKADKNKAKSKPKVDQDNSGSGMASLGDLPGFGKPNAQPVRFKDEDSGGFDDFDFEEDVIGDSSNKFDDAEKHLRDFEQEQQTGYKFEHPASKGKK